MIIHPVYALIKDDQIVNMIICDDGYTMANYIARAAFGDDAIAVDASQYNVAPGDIYRDGCFYKRENEEEIRVDMTPTAEEELPTVKQHLTEVDEYALNIDYQLALMQLGLS